MKQFLTCALVLVLLCAMTCPSAAVTVLPQTENSGETQPTQNIETEEEALPIIGEEEIIPPTIEGGGRMVFWPPPRPIWITEVIPPQVGNPVNKLPMLQLGDSLDTISDELPQILFCNAKDTDNAIVFYPCPVEWDLSDEAATASSGRITINGILKPETDCFLAEGFNDKVTYSAVVAGEPSGGPEVLNQISASFLPVGLLAVGGAPKESLKSSPATCFTDVPGEYFECSIEWDLSQINQNLLGTYPIVGTPNLPVGFAPPPDLKPFTRSIVVMDGTKADLSAASFEPETHCVSCRWIYTIPEDTPVELEYAVGKDEWKSDDKNYMGYNKYLGNFLTINLSDSDSKFELKTDYYFRITYGESDKKITSNVLHIRLENWDFLNSESAPPTFDIGGDRDGGDHGGSDLPSLEQPSPKEDDSDEEDDPISPIVETVTETSTTLSGVRLNQLTASSSTVLFEKQGVAMELSAEFLSALGLKDWQLLKVTIERPTSETFRIAVYADNKLITKLPKTVVHLPKPVAEPPLECTNQEGIHISDVTYNPKSDTIQCTVSETGTYYIKSAVSEAAVPKNPLPQDVANTLRDDGDSISVDSTIDSAVPKAVPPPADKADEPIEEPPYENPKPITPQENPPARGYEGEPILITGVFLIGAWWLLRRRHNRG